MSLAVDAVILGLAGLIGMAALGHGHSHAHSSGHGHDLGHGHGGHTPGHDPGSHLSPEHGLPGHGHAAPHAPPGSPALDLLALASPRVLFSVILGFGMTGLVVPPHGLLGLLIALVGGVLFELLLIRPYWSFLLRFASRPAHTLDSAVMTRGEAVTTFNAAGQGLITLELDGQVRQVLATLTVGERDQGVRVRRGDRVLVREVQPGSGACVVSKVK
ncbi:hypothetical protein [Deinococcus hopiensis]|uniref:Membrane protein implicated in regulation of membrane protease activity n=1 Tax=Deinococcus hopiensis KR-140 TaxID=695939 RepID=A0A1W1VFE7_9DEIO|nr:hypothetical protein [Deinococcus hopiensis]SMB92098.1 hypothetical protein SAMN00790413_01441 [Deinococcus hopiensis KR-140]